MVRDAHFERSHRLLRKPESNLPEADDAQRRAIGVVRHGGDVLVCLPESIRIAGARGEVGAGKGAVRRKKKEDGGVGDGLCTRGGGVAVQDAVAGEGAGVDPVEAGAGGGVDFAGWGEEGAERAD